MVYTLIDDPNCTLYTENKVGKQVKYEVANLSDWYIIMVRIRPASMEFAANVAFVSFFNYY